jgi:YidC/Oxa1 family membrane protein insertase
MKQVKPRIDEIKEEYGDDKEKQAQKMMEAYAEYNVNPFAGILIIIIQFPIIIALYYVFLNGGLPEVNTELVYSFIHIPDIINMTFLGTDLVEKSFVLAAIAGLSQYMQTWVSNKLTPEKKKEKKVSKKDKGPDSFVDELKDNMGGKLMYILPGVVFVISYSLPAVIAVYWATSNVFQTLQTVYVNKVISDEGKEEKDDTDVSGEDN